MNSPRRKPAPQSAADFDRLLDAALAAEHDALLPSSGFTGSVMAAIAHDATAPAPIPFPWKRALPGLAAAALVLALLLVVVVSLLFAAPAAPAAPVHAADPAALISLLRSSLYSSQDKTILLWTLVSLGLSVASFAFLRRLVTAH